MSGQGRQKRLPVQRLGQVVVHPGRQAPIPVLSHGVGGHGDDRDFGQPQVPPDSPGGLVPVDLRHLNVHEDRVVGGLPQAVQRFGAVFGRVHPGTGIGQNGLGHVPEDRLVLDHQHPESAQALPFLASGERRLVDGLARLLPPPKQAGKMELAARPLLAFNPDSSAHHLGQLPTDGQTQARAPLS